MFAKRMGLPIKGFVAASNANDVVPEYLLTGNYMPRASVRTVANAMDVGAPSNFERMLWLCNDSYEQMCDEIKGFSCSDAMILDAIKEIYENTGYISDPHSAVGYLATKKYKEPGFWLSTAHAAKFCEVIEQAVGKIPDMPDGLSAAMVKEKDFTRITSEDTDLKTFLQNL
jgi:threonine synthase